MIERQHHLDALRGFAMLLGIALHAAFGFLPPGGVLETPTDRVLEWFVVFVHAFRMPLFFLMAGLFGAMLYHRDVRRFVSNRAERIALPLLVGIPLLLPLGAMSKDWALGEPISPSLNNPEHLWFLEYLLLYYVAALAIGRVTPARAAVSRHGAALGRLLFSGPLPALNLAATTSLVLIVTGGWGEDPALSFIPEVAAFAYYGAFFALGWFLWPHRELLMTLQRHPQLHAAAALVLSVVLVWVFERWSTVGSGSTVLGGPAIAYLTLGPLVCWLAISSLYGGAVRIFNVARPSVRYLVDASYFMYLAHEIVLALLYRPLLELGLPAALGFPLLVAVASAVLLAVYQLTIRHTVVGRVLHGPRDRGRRGTSAPNSGSTPP